MKLYTEEQLRIAIAEARVMEDWWDMVYEHEADDIIKKLTQITLPSDEEIDKQTSSIDSGMHRMFYKTGVQWVLNKIKNK